MWLWTTIMRRCDGKKENVPSFIFILYPYWGCAKINNQISDDLWSGILFNQKSKRPIHAELINHRHNCFNRCNNLLDKFAHVHWEYFWIISIIIDHHGVSGVDPIWIYLQLAGPISCMQSYRFQVLYTVVYKSFLHACRVWTPSPAPPISATLSMDCPLLFILLVIYNFAFMFEALEFFNEKGRLILIAPTNDIIIW